VFDDILVVVVGGLNTDIVGLGFENLVGSGPIAYGERLLIGPGGKWRNMAQMMAALCAALSRGVDFSGAAESAVAAGTLQFHKAGIVPVTAEELARVK
jgi:hypothetical protein